MKEQLSWIPKKDSDIEKLQSTTRKQESELREKDDKIKSLENDIKNLQIALIEKEGMYKQDPLNVAEH